MSNENDYARIVLPGTLEITRTLPASPEVVWKYLVDPELRQLLFCAGETGSAPGEPFTMDFDHLLIAFCCVIVSLYFLYIIAAPSTHQQPSLTVIMVPIHGDETIFISNDIFNPNCERARVANVSL